MPDKISVDQITEEQRQRQFDINGTLCTLEEIIFQAWVNKYDKDNSPSLEDMRAIAELEIDKTYWLEFAGEWIKRIK